MRRSDQEWIDAANERVQDAETLLLHRANSLGAVYMAGYVVELNLKALWETIGKQPPMVHDLRRLWIGAGFKLSDLRDNTGAKSFFLEDWNTSLRYESRQNYRYSAVELLNAAKKLAQQVRQRISREKKRRIR